MTEELLFGVLVEKIIDLGIWLVALFAFKKIVLKDLISQLCGIFDICRVGKRYTPREHRKLLKEMDERIKKRNANQ